MRLMRHSALAAERGQGAECCVALPYGNAHRSALCILSRNLKIKKQYVLLVASAT